MSSTTNRLTKTGLLLGLAIAALAGCAVTTGGAPARASLASPSSGYTVCSGGHASRFSEHAQSGRICTPALSLQAIY
jgi:hypothetical protein